VAGVQHQIAALVFGGLAGFARIKMVLARTPGYEFAALGLLYSFYGSFVGFDFRHRIVFLKRQNLAVFSFQGLSFSLYCLLGPT
jgi:hypothetical protein